MTPRIYLHLKRFLKIYLADKYSEVILFFLMSLIISNYCWIETFSWPVGRSVKTQYIFYCEDHDTGSVKAKEDKLVFFATRIIHFRICRHLPTRHRFYDIRSYRNGDEEASDVIENEGSCWCVWIFELRPHSLSQGYVCYWKLNLQIWNLYSGVLLPSQHPRLFHISPPLSVPWIPSFFRGNLRSSNRWLYPARCQRTPALPQPARCTLFLDSAVFLKMN